MGPLAIGETLETAGWADDGDPGFRGVDMVDDTTWFVGNYPLVMTNIAMENHNF
jgi:hypothetical protein